MQIASPPLADRNDSSLLVLFKSQLYIYFVKKSYTYLMTNKNKTVIYVGVTSNLIKRVYQHKTKFYKGFTTKYNCDRLIYFEEFDDIILAIKREKQLKAGNRKRKEHLVNTINPNWKDLSEGWLFQF